MLDFVSILSIIDLRVILLIVVGSIGLFIIPLPFVISTDFRVFRRRSSI